MKKNLIAITFLMAGAVVATSQTQNSAGSAPAPARPSRPPASAPAQVPQPNVRFGTGQPGPSAVPGTNRVLTGTTNSGFGGTNQVTFGATNQPFSTNAQGVVTGGGGRIGTNQAPPTIAGQGALQDPSGAARPGFTNQTAQPGVTNQAAGAAEVSFNQRLGAAVSQQGSHQIYSPANRSAITVINQGGVITLRGTVRNEGQRRSIEARLKNMQGVVSINNQLQIAPDAGAGNPINGAPDQRQLLNP